MNTQGSQDSAHGISPVTLSLRVVLATGIALVTIVFLKSIVRIPVSFEFGLILLVIPYAGFEILELWSYHTSFSRDLAIVLILAFVFIWVTAFGNASLVSLGVIPMILVMELIPVNLLISKFGNFFSVFRTGDVFDESASGDVITRVQSIANILNEEGQTKAKEEQFCPDCGIDWSQLLIGRHCPNCGYEIDRTVQIGRKN